MSAEPIPHEIDPEDLAAISQDEGPSQKGSVSMPAKLAKAVRRRTGKGEFSQYVTAAVSRQLELDLLDELSEQLKAKFGAVPEELVEEAMRAWPDVE
jgi:hypothetical protein